MVKIHYGKQGKKEFIDLRFWDLFKIYIMLILVGIGFYLIVLFLIFIIAFFSPLFT